MTRCVDCGFDSPEGHRFCGSCGARLGVHAPGRCPECTRLVGPRDRFCMDCGASLPASGTGSRPSPEPPAASPDPGPAPRHVTLEIPARNPLEEDTSDHPTAAMRAPVQLKIVAGREVDKGFILPAEGGVIGRTETADVRLELDPYVSESHAKIGRGPKGVFVEDMGSVNGTFVRVTGTQPLKAGDEVKIGQSIFRVEK